MLEMFRQAWEAVFNRHKHAQLSLKDPTVCTYVYTYVCTYRRLSWQCFWLSFSFGFPPLHAHSAGCAQTAFAEAAFAEAAFAEAAFAEGSLNEPAFDTVAAVFVEAAFAEAASPKGA